MNYAHQVNHHQMSQQVNSNLNFPDFTTTQQPPTYLQAAYSSHLTSPYVPDGNQLSPNMTVRNEMGHATAPASARDNANLRGAQRPHHMSENNSMRSSHNSSMGGSVLDEQRKQEILQRLQVEREMRRRMIQEGEKQGSVSTAGFADRSIAMSSHFQGQHIHQNDSGTPQSKIERQSVSSQFNQNNDIVHRLLNERRLNRSDQHSQHNISNYSQHMDNNSDEEEHVQQQYSARNENGASFGGFNPEALYQEDAIREYSQQNRSNSREGNYSHRDASNDEEIEDARYQQAVEYARSQIERDRLKKLQILHQSSSKKIMQNPSERALIAQNWHGDSSSQGSKPRSRSQSQENNNQLPPSVQNVERTIQKHSIDKQITEMNSKPSRHNGSTKHCFTYESEDEFQCKKPSSVNKRSQKNINIDQRGFREPLCSTVKTPTSSNQITGDYMKTTVNADFKKQGDAPTATIAKTKQIIADTERKFKEEHTFKPQINEYSLPPSKEVSKEERWKKLTEPKTLESQKRERIRAQIEIEETQKTCPFKPQTLNTTSKSGRSSTNGKGTQYESIPLPERLLHEADLRKEKREKLKRELEHEQMKECSFKPTLLSANGSNTSHSSIVGTTLNKLDGRDPIHQRVQDLQKDKNEKLQRLRMKSEQDQQSEYTFQPHVNKKSAKIAIIKQSQEQTSSVVDRLYRDANDRIEKQMNHNVSVNEQQNKDYSFHPHISKSSAYLSAQSDMFSGNMKDFYDRQEAFVKRQQENKHEAHKKWAGEERYSFHPEINATSEVICESDPTRGAESEADKIQRLYQKDMKRQEVVRENVEKEIYSQYTYKPQINKVSQAIARNGASIDELSYNPKGRERKELLQEQLMTQEFSDCTFRPQTTKSKKYQNVSSSYSMGDCSTTEDYSRKLKEKLKEKQERIAQERREREYQQLKDCTFQPKILDKEPSTVSSENVIVKGFSRHLELKELKKKQEEERRFREAEVFGLNHKFAVNVQDLDISKLSAGKQGKCHQTVPQPFELTNQGRLDENKHALLLKELKEREMSECTFKPSTNEGRNKKIINELLQQMEGGNQESLRMPGSYRGQAYNGTQRGVSNDDKENLDLYHNYSQYQMPMQMMMPEAVGHNSSYF